MSDSYTPNLYHPVTDDSWKVLVVNPSGTTSPERVSVDHIHCHHAVFLGYKSPGTANTGDATWVGPNDLQQPYPLESESQLEWKDNMGRGFDLYDLWIKIGTAGDGAVVVYR